MIYFFFFIFIFIFIFISFQSKLNKALKLEREAEAETALSSNFDTRDDVTNAHRTLLHLYHHKQISDYIGEDSPEAIRSYYEIAQSYKDMGNTGKALDFALKGLYYGEVLFGSYSEVTYILLVSFNE